MKKVKQILAIIGIIILVGLYVSTLIFAAIGSEDAMDWFRASVYATVVLPVLIWAYGLVYRLLKNHYSVQEEIASDEEAASEVQADESAEENKADDTSDTADDNEANDNN